MNRKYISSFSVPEEEGKPSPPRLLPVVFMHNDRDKVGHDPDRSKCLFLLKALRVTQDPKRLAQMMGMKRVAEVYRTLDKLAIRREYHDAWVKLGIDFPYILSHFKDVIEHGKGADRVASLKALLKSVGMDEYKESESDNSGGWEEILGKKIEALKDLQGALPEANKDYEVIAPSIPSDVRMLSTGKDDR